MHIRRKFHKAREVAKATKAGGEIAEGALAIIRDILPEASSRAAQGLQAGRISAQRGDARSATQPRDQAAPAVTQVPTSARVETGAG